MSEVEQAGGSGVFEGRYHAGFEVSWFMPDGSNETWWATGKLPAVRDDGQPRAFRIVCRAKVGPRGKYGHLDSCDREMLVEETLFCEDIAERKKAELLALAKLRQAARWDGYHCIGDYHGGAYECDFVSPYSKVAHNVDAEVFIVLQDWLGHDKLSGPLLPDAATLGYLPELPTNRVLHSLVSETFGRSIEQTYATNLFPFIKPGNLSSRIPVRLMVQAATQFAIPQIMVVQPKVVVCLGLVVCNALRCASGFRRIATIDAAIEEPFQIGDSVVWCQAHTGTLGQKNRNRLDRFQTREDWAGCERPFRDRWFRRIRSGLARPRA